MWFQHFNISSSPHVWEQSSPRRYFPPELQLSFGLWLVQKGAAVGGQDLPGFGCGQLTFGSYHSHLVSFPQR